MACWRLCPVNLDVQEIAEEPGEIDEVERQGLSHIRFRFGGQIIKVDTPTQLELDNEDTIDLVYQQPLVPTRATTQLQRVHWPFFSIYRGYPGNHIELAARVAKAVLSDGHDLSWGCVVTLVTFAGTLLDRGPPVTIQQVRRNEITWDCQRLVALLCARLTGQHRAWLQAQGGWDGFCVFYRTPLLLTFWKRLLVRTFLSCFVATALLFAWTRVYREL
ncbi:bcl-2-like protein 10 [Lepus europaeus]|uniref:bcl-2-like protein 10 n=1 Tax=Lepus europaeus TaxID=9983 RepID=UPI002B46439A|nr:bcl-2-like protein 10 [Lepus europaeus]